MRFPVTIAEMHDRAIQAAEAGDRVRAANLFEVLALRHSPFLAGADLSDPDKHLQYLKAALVQYTMMESELAGSARNLQRCYRLRLGVARAQVYAMSHPPPLVRVVH